MERWSGPRAKALQTLAGLVIAACGWLSGSSCGASNGGAGGGAAGTLGEGEECGSDDECASGACGDESGLCESKCIPNDYACGPSDHFVDACCSGYCGPTGTCK